MVARVQPRVAIGPRLPLVFLAYALCAWLGLQLALPGTLASPVWPPSGIGLAALLFFGVRAWPAVFLGALCANAVALLEASPGSAGWLIAVTCTTVGIGNTLEALFAAHLLRPEEGSPRYPGDARQFGRLIVVTLIACAISASTGVFTMAVTGFVPLEALGAAWLTWWTGDVVGILTVGLAALAWFGPREGATSAGGGEAFAIALTLTLLALFALGPWTTGRVGAGLVYLAVPSLAWAVFRFGPRGGTAAVLLLAGCAVWGSIVHPGPFAFEGVSRTGVLLLLQGFIAVCSVTSLLLWVALAGRRRAEEALRELNESLEERVAVAGEVLRVNEVALAEARKLESMGLLAGSVAHDMNNLLQGVFLHGGLARQALSAGSPALEHLDELDSTAHALSALARRMLDYAGEGKLRTRRVDLDAVGAEVVGLLGARLGEVRLEQELAAEGEVLGDPVQLGQVIHNLLTNAIEATESAGGGVVRLRTSVAHRDDLRARGGEALAAGDYLLIEVRDEGAGIAPEVEGRLFDPFVTSKEGGRGLGLAAVQGLVAAHGGAIEATSTEEGACFKAWLPLAAAELAEGAGEAPSADRAEPAEPTRGEHRGRILVADDSKVIRLTAARLLESIGYEVVVTADGEEAYERFAEDPMGFELVLLDHSMPRLDGPGALARMRELRAEQPALFMSGYTQHQLGLSSGVALLGKPFGPDALTSAVEGALAQSLR